RSGSVRNTVQSLTLARPRRCVDNPRAPMPQGKLRDGMRARSPKVGHMWGRAALMAAVLTPGCSSSEPAGTGTSTPGAGGTQQCGTDCAMTTDTGASSPSGTTGAATDAAMVSSATSSATTGVGTGGGSATATATSATSAVSGSTTASAGGAGTSSGTTS